MRREQGALFWYYYKSQIAEQKYEAHGLVEVIGFFKNYILFFFIGKFCTTVFI